MIETLEVIDWLDSSGHDDSRWRGLKEFKKLKHDRIRSTGFVVKETDDYVTLVAHVSERYRVGQGDLCILKRCIFNRRSIRLGKMK